MEGIEDIYTSVLSVKASQKTLRDYFAARAMQSLILRSSHGEVVLSSSNSIPVGAYKLADAMLLERSRTLKEKQ